MSTQTLRISVRVAEKALRAVIPSIDSGLAVVKHYGGRTHVPAGIVNRLKAFGVQRWADLYLEPHKLTAISLLGVYTPAQLEEMARRLLAASEDDRVIYWERLIEQLCTETWADEWVREYMEGMSPEEIAADIKEVFEVAGDDLRKEISLKVQANLFGVTTAFYNAFAMMAYGTPITDLVARAAKGDLQSYYKAYHVDQTVAEIPQFAELHEQKKQELKGDFFNALSLRRRTPLVPARMKYPKLWYAFAFVDSFGLLPSREGGGFSVKHLLDICIDLKIYGASEARGEDDLNKRLRDYRELQRKLKNRKFTK